MPPPREKPPRTAGQRAGVTRDAVLDAARALAEREGLEQVTMRRLAAELGVTPNSLYTYFPNKTAILDAVLDAVLGGLRPPDPDTADWREGAAELMRASRRLLLAHPHLIPLFISRPGGANAVRLGELTLRFLERGGVRGRKAVGALRALLAYTMGSVAIEAPRAADPESEERLARAGELIRSFPDGEVPAMRAAAEELATHPGDEDFEAGLGWLL
ncbi:MAG TPA: TetR/AcrR family transcriptional regulator, partial [Longimicrobiaceae bacterium]